MTVSLPEGAGAALPDAARRFARATAGCADVRTVVAESRLSGTVGRARVRATLLAGVDRAGHARIEAIAGPGGPVLVVTARDGEATLVLTREHEVLEGVSVGEALDALAGVRLEAADLALVLSGCFGADGVPLGGRSFSGLWAAFDLRDTTTVWTRGEPDRSYLLAARRGLLTVAYDRIAGKPPSRVRLLARDPAAPAQPAADLTLILERVELNGTIEPDAFVARVPRDARPITLDELRRSGPLGAGGRVP